MLISMTRFFFSLFLGVSLALSVLALGHIVSVPQFAHAQPTEEGFADEFQEEQTPVASVGNLIQVSLGFLGILAIVTIIMGAVTYATAGGSDDAQVRGRRMFGMGLIGLALIVSIWAITAYVLASITGTNQSL